MTALSTLAAFSEIRDTYRAGAAGDTDAAKSCCAAVYGIDLIGLFLGDSYHPGGIELTRRLADLVALQPGEQVRQQLSGVAVPAVVPNAAELADLLVPSRHGSRTLDPNGAARTGQVQVNLGRTLR